MKKIILCFLVFCCWHSNAQKIRLDEGVVSENGIPVFKIEMNGSKKNPYYLVSSVEEEDLMTAELYPETKDQKKHYDIVFIGLESYKAQMPADANFQINFINNIVKYKLIKNGFLTEDNVRKFCYDLAKKNNANEGNQPVKIVKSSNEENENSENNLANDAKEKPNQKSNYTIVKKDSISEINIVNGNIMQGATVIGKINSVTGLINKKAGHTITVYSIDNKRIAIVKYINNSSDATLNTYKDGQTQTITINGTNANQINLDVVKQLIELAYL